ncbi:MAG: retron St85 family RNA-directed DNA polymerase, partial [Clostridiales bacterium]|nr:retron St85 family RNA-directed DNA polymerase [Clostridiales bacterium]
EKTGFSKKEIYNLLGDTSREYRVYTIPKSDGGKRTICEPSDAMKKLQTAVSETVKNGGFVERFATAYENGSSVKSNAARHIDGEHVLHADIKNFFPSITREMFFAAYKKSLKNNEQDLDFLWRIVSYQGGLPIGASTSPFIANRVMRRIDKKLGRVGFFITYTRYADDMIFSSKKRLKPSLIAKVEKILTEEGFSLNRKKTYFMTNRKEITGVIITDAKKLSVGTAYKKRLKSEIYNLLVKQQGNINHVRGRYAHLKFIEPAYARRLKAKYSGLDSIGFFKK